MKLIIDIDEDVYKKIVADKYAIYDKMFYSIKNGTPLDEVLDKIRAEIEDLDRFYDNDYFSGNRDSMFKCNEVMQIFDKYRKEQE